MSEADVTVTVSWDGLRGHYGRASIQDSSISLSQDV